MPFLHRMNDSVMGPAVDHKATLPVSATAEVPVGWYATSSLSHQAINAALKQAWQKGAIPALKGNVQLVQDEHGWALHGIWSAPQIRFDFHHDDRRAWLLLELRNGALRTQEGFGPRSKTVVRPFQKLCFALPVGLESAAASLSALTNDHSPHVADARSQGATSLHTLQLHPSAAVEHRIHGQHSHFDGKPLTADESLPLAQLLSNHLRTMSPIPLSSVLLHDPETALAHDSNTSVAPHLFRSASVSHSTSRRGDQTTVHLHLSGARQEGELGDAQAVSLPEGWNGALHIDRRVLLRGFVEEQALAAVQKALATKASFAYVGAGRWVLAEAATQKSGTDDPAATPANPFASTSRVEASLSAPHETIVLALHGSHGHHTQHLNDDLSGAVSGVSHLHASWHALLTLRIDAQGQVQATVSSQPLDAHHQTHSGNAAEHLTNAIRENVEKRMDDARAFQAELENALQAAATSFAASLQRLITQVLIGPQRAVAQALALSPTGGLLVKLDSPAEAEEAITTRVRVVLARVHLDRQVDSAADRQKKGRVGEISLQVRTFAGGKLLRETWAPGDQPEGVIWVPELRRELHLEQQVFEGNVADQVLKLEVNCIERDARSNDDLGTAMVEVDLTGSCETVVLRGPRDAWGVHVRVLVDSVDGGAIRESKASEGGVSQ